MGYVLVTADFPGIIPDQRNKIYECLEKKKWYKVTELGRDISTTWYGYFPTETESQAIEIAHQNFESCSTPYCKPKLVIHWGTNKPTFKGLR